MGRMILSLLGDTLALAAIFAIAGAVLLLGPTEDPAPVTPVDICLPNC
jgi:hypothetical protein